MFGAKVEIAAREKGVDFELEMVAYLRIVSRAGDTVTMEARYSHSIVAGGLPEMS
jgi:hypothetical protein